MTIDSRNINALWGSLVIEELVRSGVTYFCISPGSRSTPLTVAAARNYKAKTVICYDERAAAFLALGYARGSGNPAALISTSGTAVANYLPAVIEASIDNCPMIVLTADRPPELRETGANQTVQQPEIYGNYARWFFDVPCPDTSILPEMVLTTIDQAVYRSRRSPAGPVHLNFQFREPLAPVKKNIPGDYLDHLKNWHTKEGPRTHYFTSLQAVPESEIQKVRQQLMAAKNGILVVGRLGSKRDREAVRNLADKFGWPVFADVLSGVRMGYTGKNLIPYYDQMFNSESFLERFQPDFILHLGGVLTSKRYLQFVQKLNDTQYILVAETPYRQDPAHGITHRLETSISEFCERILENFTVPQNSDWLEWLLNYSRNVGMVIDKFLQQSGKINEPLVARTISQNILENQALFLASSLPIREVDMFADNAGAEVEIAANRGASGIDGTIASAVGFATTVNSPTTLLIGDLALLHDINSLSLIHSIPQPLTIVLINNKGGGIFSFLPIAGFNDVFEPFFGTPHNFSFQHAAKLFNIEYNLVTEKQEFVSKYCAAIQQNQSGIIEVQTDRKENFDLHKELKKHIVSAFEK